MNQDKTPDKSATRYGKMDGLDQDDVAPDRVASTNSLELTMQPILSILPPNNY
jgi:hypothetical protein